MKYQWPLAWFTVLTTIAGFGEPAALPNTAPPATAHQVSLRPPTPTGGAPADAVEVRILTPPSRSRSQSHPKAVQAYSHGNPSAAEQYLLEFVNRARANPAGEATLYGIDLNEGLGPGTISPVPKPPLAFNPDLIQSARGHSQWMLDNDTFSHTGVNGTNPKDREVAAGYVLSGSWSVGENIAWRGTTGLLDLNSTVAQIHDDLFVDTPEPGRGHRINLMSTSFREIGIGIVPGTFTAGTTTYNAAMVTQDFGKTDAQPASFLVGVVFQDSNGNGFYDPGEGLSGVTVTPATGQFYAVSSDSGGFAIPLGVSGGSLLVTASGGSLTGPITKSVTLTGANVKLDFNTVVDQPTAPTFSIVAPQVLTDSTVTFQVSGQLGVQAIIQSSDDLAVWTDRRTVTIGPSTTYTDSQAGNSAHRFYRLRQQ